MIEAEAGSPLVSGLAEALESAGISYCHWKSNAHLDKALRAETDLDLLIAREHSAPFGQVLGSLGFVRASRRRDARVPGTAHHFAYDPSLDRFVHVHAHFQLVVGHDRSKNFRLPIESEFLGSSSRVAGELARPSAEFEYVVFVIRMALKYAIWDELIWEGMRGRRAGPAVSERQEWADLRARIDETEVSRILSASLPFVDEQLFADAEATMSGTSSLAKTIATGRRMERALEAHARVSTRLDGLVRLWRRIVVFTRRRARRSRGFQLDPGGAIIAIMGGDGAGKSTAVTWLTSWLEAEFDVTRVHLGKPPRSLTTHAVRGVLALADRARRFVPLDVDRISADDDSAGLSFDEFRRICWLACIARDRHRAYRRARRAANRGSVVVADRFPHPALKVMDVAQIDRLFPRAGSSPLTRGMMRAEEWYHSLMSAPDVAIVLVVDPKVAASRKTDEKYEYVLKRSQEIWEMDWDGTGVHVVDASRPTQEVVEELKEIIWQELT